MIRCKKCCADKRPEDFYVRNDTGLPRKECKACVGERNRIWRAANPEKDRAYSLRSVTKFQRNNREAYLAKKRAYEAKRRANPSVQLGRRMSVAIREGLNGTKHRRSWFSIVGYDLEDLRSHLERQFLRGMGWENMGDWHIDHIVPLSSFAFTGPDDPEFKRAWALANLRPLWASENIRKKAKRTHLL